MVYACSRGGLDPVHQAVITNINSLTHNLLQENHLEKEDINAIVSAGNTTMSHFLLEFNALRYQVGALRPDYNHLSPGTGK